MAAEVEGTGKAPRDVVEAVRQTLADLADEEIVTAETGRRAVPVAAHGGAVEYVHGLIHDGLPRNSIPWTASCIMGPEPVIGNTIRRTARR